MTMGIWATHVLGTLHHQPPYIAVDQYAKTIEASSVAVIMAEDDNNLRGKIER